MKKSVHLTKYKSLVVVIAMLAALFAGCNQTSPQAPQSSAEAGAVVSTSSAADNPAPENTPESAPSSSRDRNSAAYLKHYYGVSFEGEITAQQFNDGLQKLSGESSASVEGELTYLSAVKAAVISADFDELAQTYSDEKADKRLSEFGIEGAGDKAYLACAIDTGLLTQAQGKAASQGDAITLENAVELLMRVAEANGKARNMLGYSDELDIYNKLNNAWDSFLLFDDPQLTALGKTSVEKSITTGYNLKHSAYSARFLPNLTMQYGHSDIKHAHQLIGLLNSENITARVQLEPKVSVYQYLLEWGPVPDPSPGYEVRKFDNDLYLVFALEYDLELEFASDEDLLRFDSIIEEYAKKYEGNEEAVGLLYGSWWQPLYSTTRDDMPADTYHKIYDCVITNGDYSIHPFCLAENYEFVVGEFAKIDSSLKVDAVTRYCNTAFYNYMSGEDYQ